MKVTIKTYLMILGLLSTISSISTFEYKLPNAGYKPTSANHNLLLHSGVICL